MATPSGPVVARARGLAAVAQILPLGQIHTSDARIRAAIGKLASAYRAFFASNGTSPAAKTAVASAANRINSFCPGAAS